MVNIYYKVTSKEEKKYVEKLRKSNQLIKIQNITEITEKEIFQLLYLSDLDIIDIIRKDVFSPLHKWKVQKLMKMRFRDSLLYLQKNYKLLQTPIVISSQLSTIGDDNQNLETLFK